MKRRKFLLTSGTVVLASGVGLAQPLSVLAAAKEQPRLTGELSKAAFLAYLNERFWVSDGTRGVIDLTLVAVTDQRPRPHHHDFTLTFAGPSEEPLAAGTYEFEHAWSGRFKLYIEPINLAGLGRHYRADLSILN